MDVETRLRTLESRYRATLIAACAAQTRYFELAGQPSAMPDAIQRAKTAWIELDARHREIAARMGECGHFSNAPFG